MVIRQHNALTWNLLPVECNRHVNNNAAAAADDDDDYDAHGDDDHNNDDDDDHVGIIAHKHSIILHHIYSGIRYDINGVP